MMLIRTQKLMPHEIETIELAADRYPAAVIGRWLGRSHDTVLRCLRLSPDYKPFPAGKQCRYPWLEMEIGDKRVVTYEDSTNRRVRDAASAASKRYGRKYETKAIARGTLIKRTS